jgi:hypothetical protein
MYYDDQMEEDEMGCVEHVAHMEEKRNTYKILVGKLKQGDHLEDLDIDGG